MCRRSELLKQIIPEQKIGKTVTVTKPNGINVTAIKLKQGDDLELEIEAAKAHISTLDNPGAKLLIDLIDQCSHIYRQLLQCENELVASVLAVQAAIHDLQVRNASSKSTTKFNVICGVVW